MLNAKKNEDSLHNPFGSLDRSAAIQDAREFNNTPIKPARCVDILTKILYLINQGDIFNADEATSTFFAMTKLFQHQDETLRRMCYLTIKAMANMTENAFIITQSLTKDMNGKNDAFRGSSVRALCSIMDGATIMAIERHMKQAIVDKQPHVASAALVSAFHLARRGNHDVVKRWVNEAQEATQTENTMVQYHALGLLYQLRKNDKLAVTKLLQRMTKGGTLRSSFGYCLLIRIAGHQIEEEPEERNGPLFEFITDCLRNKHEMVVYEAASAIVNMAEVSQRELAPAVTVLQQFCSSPKPSLRYAGVRTLSKVAMKYPAAVTACNLDLENLITDSNRSIATLAITTLLKTGTESSVDRLMKQITSFMSDVADELKVVVVQAIGEMCMKFPKKHALLLQHLSTMLRDEGGYEYKKAIIECIVTIIDESQDSRETGLSHLCEFIEDCEHTNLCVKILHMLGRDGPNTSNPSKYIRFIYNRVVLENETIRAASVTALAKFGAACPDLCPRILILLERCLLDEDDETRDRAAYYLRILREEGAAEKATYILNPLQVSVQSLERQLQHYVTTTSGETPFDIKNVQIDIPPVVEEAKSSGAAAHKAKKPVNRIEKYLTALRATPQLEEFGPVFKSSDAPQNLTEAETEYKVRVIKHTYKSHIVLQFEVMNTLEDQLLEDVLVEVEGADGFEATHHLPAAKAKYNEAAITYTVLEFAEGGPDEIDLNAVLPATLKFKVKDVDPNDPDEDTDEIEAYEDEYALEDVELAVADHVQRIIKPNFQVSWDQMDDAEEVKDTYQLSTIPTLEQAVKDLQKFLGLYAQEKTDKIPEGQGSHTLLLAGVFRGGIDIMAKSRLVLTKEGVTMELTVRSTDIEAAQFIASAVA